MSLKHKRPIKTRSQNLDVRFVVKVYDGEVLQDQVMIRQTSSMQKLMNKWGLKK